MPDTFLIKMLMKKWLKSMESEFAEEFLEALLKAMRLAFLINYRGFRRNIDGFNGSYLFKNKDTEITVSVVFKDNKMKVSEKPIDAANVTVIFRDGKTLMNYILSQKPDILGSILRQDVTFDGNLNYLSKFAYMARRLQLMATGEI